MQKYKRHETFWSEMFNQNSIHEFKNWVQNNSVSREWLSKFLRQMEIESILDVGCGIALDYEQFQRDGLEIDYHGIDITPVFLKYIKNKYPNLDVRFATAGNIPHSSRAFDAVFCRHLLEHLKDPTRAISEMARVSKKFLIIIWFIPPINGRENEIKLMNFGDTGRVFYQNTYSLEFLNLIIKNNDLMLKQIYKIGTDEAWILRNLQ